MLGIIASNLSGAGLPRFTLTNCTYSIQNLIKKPGQFAQTGFYNDNVYTTSSHTWSI
jgi:hypothetical protein